MATGESGSAEVTYEELAELEYEFDEVDLQIIRQQYRLTAPLYRRRHALLSKIEHFWPLVFEQSPDLEAYIQPTDSEVFAECLKTVQVSRFELPTADGLSEGEPRSLQFTFEFAPNPWFDDGVLEKKFWFRRSRSGQTGLVSEPVKIRWKAGKDLTHGLSDAALRLWEAWNRQRPKEEKTLPEYNELVRKMERSDEGTLTFFAWFGYVSNTRYVSAEESAAANAVEASRREKKKSGELAADGLDAGLDAGLDGVDQEFEEREAEIFTNGEEVATVLAEEVWPQAIKYFTQAQEADDDDVSDIGFENESDGNSLDGESNNSPTDFGKGKRSAVNGDGQQKKRARRQ